MFQKYTGQLYPQLMMFCESIKAISWMNPFWIMKFFILFSLIKSKSINCLSFPAEIIILGALGNPWQRVISFEWWFSSWIKVCYDACQILMTHWSLPVKRYFEFKKAEVIIPLLAFKIFHFKTTSPFSTKLTSRAMMSSFS